MQLPFAEHMHRFIPLDSAPCREGRPKPQPRIDAAFDKAMILLYQIIQVLALPQRTGYGEAPVVLQLREGGG